MKYHLTEIFDIEELRMLCESFTNINGIITAVLDLEGNVLIANGWQPICTQFHRVNSQTSARCRQSDTVLASQLKQGQHYNVYKCMNGLVDVAMPIIVGGEHVGNFFTGQFFTETPDIEFFRRQAKEFGFDETEYLAALAKVRVLDADVVKANISFLVKFTESLGNIGVRRLASMEQARLLEIERENLKRKNAEYEVLNQEYMSINKELREAKERAEDSENTFRMLYDTISDALFANEVRDDGTLGNFIMVNDIACDRLGYTREELLKMTPADIISDNARRTLTDRVQEILEKKKVILETEQLTKDGRIIPTELSASLTRIGSKTILQAVARDISERKQTEQLIQRDKDFIEAVFESIPGILYVYDEQARLIRWNKRHETETGYSGEELASMTSSDWHFPEERSRVAQAVQEVFERGYGEVEAHLLTKDGRNPLMVFNGVRMCVEDKMYFVGIGLDITQRRQAEEALLESRATLKLVLDTIPQSVFWKDVTGHYLGCNKVFASAVGFSDPDMILGKTDFDLPWLPEDAIAYREDDKAVIESNSPKVHIIEQLQQADGKRLWIDTSKMPLCKKAGPPFGILGIYEDITQRRETEEMRKKYVMLADSSSEFIGMCDLDMKPIFVNRAGIRMVGLSDMDAACQINVLDYFFPEDKLFFTQEFFPKVLCDGEGSMEIRMRNFQTGEPIWVNYYLFSVRDDSGKIVGWATVSRDITERRQAEQALREREQDLRESQRIAHVGSWHLDMATNKVVWSEELYKMYGFDPTKPPPPYTEHMKLFTQKSWEQLSSALDNTARTGIPYELELETVRADGTNGWMWVFGRTVTDVDGKAVGLFGVAQDITERKQAEEKINQLNTQLEQRVRERTEELRVKNEALEHTISQLQDTQSQLLLFEKITVLRHLVSGIAHEINNPLGAIDSSREVLYGNIRKLVNNIGIISQWLNGPDGELLAELMACADTGIEGSMGISSREKREKRNALINSLTELGLANAQEIGTQLVTLNVCENIERFIPLLKHDDIMSKLSIVGNILDAYIACSTIKTAVSKSARIVNALRGYVRKEGDGQNKILADIKSGLDNVLLLFQHVFKSSVGLELDFAEDLPSIMCYPDQLNQVWTNIIQNGLHAMNNSGKLNIEVKRLDDGVVVRITDQGCGMTPEVKARIFEPLFTTKPAGEGLGLGMDIVHMIVVERHNGRIDIESEPGKGTTVAVWLPVN